MYLRKMRGKQSKWGGDIVWGKDRVWVKPKSVIRSTIIRGQVCNVLKFSPL